MLPECTTRTVKHLGGSAMVWGCFAGSRVGDLHRVNGILNQKGYHSILHRHALPPSKRIIGQGFILQEDNDLKHTSHLSQYYLKKKEWEGRLEIMNWPAVSWCKSHWTGLGWNGPKSEGKATDQLCTPLDTSSTKQEWTLRTVFNVPHWKNASNWFCFYRCQR